ncbi:MAG: hypothetical protein Q9216_001259 [Gyalolechia sp. 2 TL-2023]
MIIPSGDSPAILCARFLEANNYRDGKAPTKAIAICSLPSSANLLHVSLEEVKEGQGRTTRQVLFVSTADRRLHLLDAREQFTLLKSLDNIHDSPMLSCMMLASEGMLAVTTSMSGQVVLYDHLANRALDERRDHKKYVVRVAQWKDRETLWVVTAGWDAMIFLYRIRRGIPSGACRLGEPVGSLRLATNPETVTFITRPASSQPLLLVTRRDSASLHYYCWEDVDATASLAVCWRPDGSGVWVNGDDGVLRGLDATNGKIKLTLKGGHEPGSKIRSIWAGMLKARGKMEDEEEWVVSGGFDKRLVVWKPAAEETT